MMTNYHIELSPSPKPNSVEVLQVKQQNTLPSSACALNKECKLIYAPRSVFPVTTADILTLTFLRWS